MLARKEQEKIVIDFGGQILEGSMVGRTEHNVRGNHRWTTGELVNEVIMSDVQALAVESDQGEVRSGSVDC